MNTPYSRSAPGYAAAGWSPVPMTGPLPATPKGVPYEGTTGRNGFLMTPRRVELFLASDWVADYPNVSLRMNGTVGLDIDSYDGRTGAQTLYDLEAKLGPLPETWISTARDLPSGIRIFRLPAGVELDRNAEAMVRTIGQCLDVIRHDHRYCKCWPTPHPTGAIYRWFRTSSTSPCSESIIPLLVEVPELPSAWVEFLTSVPPTKISKGTSKLQRNSDVERVFTHEEALAFVAPKLDAVRTTPWEVGERFNEVLNEAAYTLRSFLGLWTEDYVIDLLAEAVRSGHGAELNGADLATIRSGLSSAQEWAARLPDERETTNPFAYKGKYAPMYVMAPSNRTVQPAQDDQTEIVVNICDAVGRVEGEPLDELFLSRPELGHVRHFARSRGVGPIGCLLTVLLRILAATPWHVVTPPLVGGVGSLNMFLALAARSGGNKSTTEDAAFDAVKLHGGLAAEGTIPSCNLGTGQGLAGAYLKWVQEPKGGPGHYARGHQTMLFRCGEVGELAALQSGTASTIGAVLREAWTGKQLGNKNADPKLDRHVPAQQYRLCLGPVGVQAQMGGVLLSRDEIARGTPQRFVWARAKDPWMPDADQRPPEPAPRDWEMPAHGGSAFGLIRYVLSVCPDAAAAIIAENTRSNREDDDSEAALDGHLLFCRLKLAAALGLFNGHAEVDCEDWYLSGLLIEHSNRTRDWVLSVVAAEDAKSVVARGRQRGREEVAKTEVVVDAAEQDMTKTILWILDKIDTAPEGEGVTGGELTRGVARLQRPNLQGALDRLEGTGQIRSETVGGSRKGLRWFRT